RRRPARLLRVEPFERLPVRPRRREDVDDHRSFGTSMNLVRRVRGDVPRLPRSERAARVADAEIDGSREDESQLLVLVVVLGNDPVRLELHDRQRESLAADDASQDAVPDAPGCDLAEVLEAAHVADRTRRPAGAGTARSTAPSASLSKGAVYGAAPPLLPLAAVRRTERPREPGPLPFPQLRAFP